MDKSNNFRLIEILNLLMVGEAVPKWIWPDHAIVVEVVYKKLVDEIKKNLNLAAMKDVQTTRMKTSKTKHPIITPQAIKRLLDGLMMLN